jgi:ATP-dependent Clp protease ATP-binding subunit ClpX
MWSFLPKRSPAERSSAAACSFCGSRNDVLLIAGAVALICRDCVIGAARALQPGERPRYSALGRLTPAEIKAALDEHVIGHDDAKRVLAVAVHNHYKRLFHRALGGGDLDIAKSNIVLIGRSGSGKTLLMKTLAGIAGVPFVIVDATTLTEAGFVGRDVDEIASALVDAAGHDVALAERGIVYIDEIDKIAALPHAASARPDIGGLGVQRGLLGLIEGRRARVEGQGRRRKDDTCLDTTDVLFICGGTFAGIEAIAADRRNQVAPHLKRPPRDEARLVSTIDAEDLIAFGLMPELVGRLAVVVVLEPLEHGHLVRILTEPKNSLVEQYRRLFRMSDVELEIQECAVQEIATRAVARGMGARGLRAVMETIFLEDMFEVPHQPETRRIVLDRRAVEVRLGALAVSGPAQPLGIG